MVKIYDDIKNRIIYIDDCENNVEQELNKIRLQYKKELHIWTYIEIDCLNKYRLVKAQ